MIKKAPRAPPAYLVYASDDLASTAYYSLDAGERGLLSTMERVYWVDRRLPCDLRLLALACRLLELDVVECFTPAVKSFFEADRSNASILHHVELRRQMENIEKVREAQAEGGKVGSRMTNEHRKGRTRSPASPPASPPASRPASRPASLVRVLERNEAKELKSNASIEAESKGDNSDWIGAYERAEEECDADQYRKASGR